MTHHGLSVRTWRVCSVLSVCVFSPCLSVLSASFSVLRVVWVATWPRGGVGLHGVRARADRCCACAAQTHRHQRNGTDQPTRSKRDESSQGHTWSPRAGHTTRHRSETQGTGEAHNSSSATCSGLRVCRASVPVHVLARPRFRACSLAARSAISTRPARSPPPQPPPRRRLRVVRRSHDHRLPSMPSVAVPSLLRPITTRVIIGSRRHAFLAWTTMRCSKSTGTNWSRPTSRRPTIVSRSSTTPID